MVRGLVPTNQGCSEALETLAREAAEAMARSDWKKMGARLAWLGGGACVMYLDLSAGRAPPTPVKKNL